LIRAILTDNAWSYIHNRGPARAAEPRRHWAPHDPSLQGAHQWQGWALPPD